MLHPAASFNRTSCASLWKTTRSKASITRTKALNPIHNHGSSMFSSTTEKATPSHRGLFAARAKVSPCPHGNPAEPCAHRAVLTIRPHGTDVPRGYSPSLLTMISRFRAPLKLTVGEYFRRLRGLRFVRLRSRLRPMHIRPAHASDHAALVALWERSVRAT